MMAEQMQFEQTPHIPVDVYQLAARHQIGTVVNGRSLSRRRTPPPHTRALAFRWLLCFGLTAASSRFLFTAHNAMRQREQTFPSHWPLFRTDDLSSQHRDAVVFCT
jgi:hypothetical protein